MKKLTDQNVKGTQDFLPEAARLRRTIRQTLEETFIEYGCEPIETPILNYTELMASKYAGGAEILEEMYTLRDRGDRDLALRYDLTIPFAKVMAMNPALRMPFKRYEIGKVFRDGPIKTGRLREFTQCDVDVAGIPSQAAEAELMQMALDAFRKLDIPITIQYNNRKLLTGMLELFGVPADALSRTILTIDKVEKTGVSGVTKELQDTFGKAPFIDAIAGFLQDKKAGTFAYYDSFSTKSETIMAGLTELRELTNLLPDPAQCRFNPFLARGLEIYTGTVFELFMDDGAIRSSIGAGGRYDNAIGGLLGTGESISTVGISFGLDVIYTALAAAPVKTEPLVDRLIIPLGTEKEALVLATALRRDGMRVEVDFSGRKLKKVLDRANKERVPAVIVLGENEVREGRYVEKMMATGEAVEQTFRW